MRKRLLLFKVTKSWKLYGFLKVIFMRKLLLSFLLLFFFGTGFLFSQNVTITPGNNPSAVVIMGDSLTFPFQLYSATALSNCELEVEVPAGFELLESTPNFKPGSLSADKLKGRILIASLPASSVQNYTVYIKALCDAETATPTASRKIIYRFYVSSTAMSPITTKPIENGIQNFYNPILHVTYPESKVVQMGSTQQRTFKFIQTREFSHVANLKVEASCNPAGFELSKIEVSHNGTSWTELTGVINSSASGYTYIISKANTFTALGYNGNHLSYGDSLFIRETVKLLSCGEGTVTYNFYSGDGVDFCTPSLGTDAVVYSEPQYTYTPDIFNDQVVWPATPTTEGHFRVGIRNNSAQAEAQMFDIYVNHYGVGALRYNKAYLCNASGVPVPGPGGATDTIFLQLSAPGTSATCRVNFQTCNDPAYTASYIAAGLSCLDGDGVYDDLEKGKTVYYIVKTSFVLAATNFNCGQQSLYSGGTRRGDLYYKTFCKDAYRTVTRDYGAGSSTNMWTGRMSINRIDEITVTPSPNLASGAEAQLNFDPHSSDNNCSNDITCGAISEAFWRLATGNGLTKTSEMWLVTVLPVGMQFVPTPTAPITALHYGGSLNTTTNVWTGGVAITAADYQYIPGTAATGDTLRIHVTSALAIGLLQNHIHIPVMNNGVADAAKQMTFWLEYDYGTTGNPVKVGCPTAQVPYTQILPCGSIGLTSFEPERRSFGYTDITKSHRVTDVTEAKSLGFNLKVASPYDDVTMVGEALVNTSMFLAGNEIWVDFSYAYSARVLNVLTGKPDAVNIYYNSVPTPIQIPATALQFSVTGTGTARTERIRVNIAPYMQGTLPTLNTNDVLRIELNLQGTTSMPVQSVTLAPTMQISTVIGGVLEECSPLVDVLTAWNSEWTNRTASSGGPSGTPFPQQWNHNTTTAVDAAQWGISWSNGAPANLWTGGEYRPNGENFTPITIEYSYLMKIHSVLRRASGTILGNVVNKDPLEETVEYTVTYANGKTYLTINPPPTDLMTSTSTTGFSYTVRQDVINYNAAYARWNSFEYDNFPTSSDPKRIVANRQAGNITANGGTTPIQYTYVIAPLAANVSPLGSRAEWTLRITNQSRFLASDSNLPHSWIAVECPAGVVPVELRDASTNTAISASFEQYATNKYWIKIDNISANPTKDYILSCTYTVCTGKPQLNIKYGMSKVDYPTDPDQGYANYNSPGVLAGVVSTQISFTPPVVKFSGYLQHFTNMANNTNLFCDTIRFEGSFSNGLATTISGLQLRVDFNESELSGYSYSSVYTPQVRFGNGTWYNAQSATIAGNVLTITLDDAKSLAGYGAANNADKAYVRFALNIACGIENGMQIPAQFIGYSGCGAATTERIATASPIRIYGLTPPPEYWIQNLSLVQSAFTGASGEDGTMLLTGKYVQAEAASTDVWAIIDLPDNLVLDVINMPSINFTQSGRRLTVELPSTTSVGTEFPFNLTLKPVNPAEWTMDSTYIYVRTGKLNSLTCDAMSCTLMEYGTVYDSVTVSMEKLQVRFSDNIDANSKYGDPTTERVVIDGWLVNDGDLDAGRLTMDLWYFNGAYYEPVDNVISGLTVNSISQHDSVPFRVVVNVSHLQDVCNMALVLRKNNTTSGSLNPYLADSVAIIIPVPKYEISAEVDEICQMDGGVVIGELPINDYTYRWDPTDNLSRATVARPTFNYDYINNPLPDDTVLEYLVSIIRPNGCVSVDTIFVPLKGLPAVDDVADMTLCSGDTFNLTFNDATNTGNGDATVFNWTIENGPNVGLPMSGSINTINTQIRNNSTTPIVLNAWVTPTKGGCSGVTKYFTIVVNPTPRVDHVIDETYCHDQIVATRYLSGNISNAVYKWEFVSGVNVLSTTSGEYFIPGFIASNTNSTASVGTYKAYAEYENGGVICKGAETTFTITVNPRLLVNITNSDQTICSGESILPINFTNNVSGTVFRWEMLSGQMPGLVSGTGNISARVITNNSTNVMYATYQVTPYNGTCSGTPSTFNIIVNPKPTLQDQSDLTLCNGVYVPERSFNGNNDNAVIRWEQTNAVNIGLSTTSGIGNLPGFTAVNSTSSDITATYKVKMEYVNNGVTCSDEKTFSLTVKPTPYVNTVNDLHVCSGGNVSVSFSGLAESYQWNKVSGT
ncbi:MAG: hypothetical protein LBQ22_06170, partial [Bacteroidales bacterium]|nr:hypothetical protein [Bacteroidales bacterium]